MAPCSDVHIVQIGRGHANVDKNDVNELGDDVAVAIVVDASYVQEGEEKGCEADVVVSSPTIKTHETELEADVDGVAFSPTNDKEAQSHGDGEQQASPERCARPFAEIQTNPAVGQ